MTAETLVPRLKSAVGKPAATLFAGPGTDRHLIAELTFGAIVMYLAGKYLDGFIKGLGIEDLGKRHGEAVAAAMSSLLDITEGSSRQEEREKELRRQEGTIRSVAQELSQHAGHQLAREQAARSVQQLLEEKGLPSGEAKRIASAIGTELVGGADG